MSTKWDLTSVQGINHYLWGLLQTELGWDADNYDGNIPIIPTQDEPEFTNYDYPYIVYNYSIQATGRLYGLKEEQIAYMVVSDDSVKIRQAINIINDYLSRWDDSAADVNKWIEVNGSTLNKKFEYKYIHILSSQGPQPGDQEGGRRDGMVIVRSCFVVDSINGIRI